MPTVLITGANRGIGLVLARQYAADGWHVIATCRDPGVAADLAALAEIGTFTEIRALDVTDFIAIKALAKKLEGRSIDVLLNNAGRLGPREKPHSRDEQLLGSFDFDEFIAQFRVNTLAPLAMAEAFADHVAASGEKKIVAVSSRVGSIAGNSSGGYYAYRASKAGLNAEFASLAKDLAPRGISVAVMHPGWVKTDMGGPGADIEVEESASGLRHVIAGLCPERSGGFFNYDGTEIPW